MIATIGTDHVDSPCCRFLITGSFVACHDG
jgi:hypothetical protein